MNQERNRPKLGLVVKHPFAEMIVSGAKTWEIRTKQSWVRERVAILLGGTKTAIGEVTLTNSFPVTRDLLCRSFEKHRIDDLSAVFQHAHNDNVQYYAWVLQHAEKYTDPKPYVHPVGAITWVKLSSPESRPGLVSFFASNSVDCNRKGFLLFSQNLAATCVCSFSGATSRCTAHGRTQQGETSIGRAEENVGRTEEKVATSSGR